MSDSFFFFFRFLFSFLLSKTTPPKKLSPSHLDQVDRDAVGDHQRRQVADVRARGQELERVAHAHVLLHLVLAALGLPGRAGRRRGLDPGDDAAVEPPVDRRDDDAEADDQGHHPAQRDPPPVDAGGEAGADLAKVLHGAPRKDQRDVGAEAEEGVKGLCLVDGGDLVGEAPEEHGDDDGAPELCCWCGFWFVGRGRKGKKR